MQSIAPNMIHIEITSPGVRIGGQDRPVGWHGEVARHVAKSLVPTHAKMYKEPSPEPKDVAEEPELVQTSDLPLVDDAEEQSPGTSKRVPRSK